MTYLTDSILCTGRITYLMISAAVTAIITYRTLNTVIGVIMICTVVNCSICRIFLSLDDLTPSCEGIVEANIRSLCKLIGLEGCNGNFAIFHSRGSGDVAVYPCNCEGLNVVTYALTFSIGMTFGDRLSTTRICLGMLSITIVFILRSLRVVIRCYFTFNTLGLCLFGNPLSLKYSGVGCYLLCYTCGCRGNCGSGIYSLRFRVSTVTYTSSGTLCIICIPAEANSTIAVTKSRNKSILIVISTYRAGMSGISINRTSRCGYYSLIAVTLCRNYVIGVVIATNRTSIRGVTFIHTSRNGYDGVVFVSLFGNIYNVLGLTVNSPICLEVSSIGSCSLFRTCCRDLYVTGSLYGFSLCITAVTLTACGARLTVFGPGVTCFAVSMCGYVLRTADVTIVVVVGSYVGTDLSALDFTAAVITYVIIVICAVFVFTEFLAASVFMFCTVVAVVIIVGIFTSANRYLTTIIARVIFICVYVFAVELITTVVTVVVEVAVLTFADCFGTAIVACVIGVVVLVLAEVCMTSVFIACAIVTVVILIGIFTSSDCHGTAVVTYVVLVSVKMLIHIHIRLTAVTVTDMVGIFICVSKSFATSCAALGTSCGNFAGCSNIFMLSYIILVAYVTLVIPISVFIGADLQNYAATVVANVIIIICAIGVCAEVFTASAFMFCAIVAVVILIGVYTSAYCFFTTVVTLVVGIDILMCAIVLITTVIAGVVKVVVLALTDCYGTAVVTLVVGIDILMCAIGLITTVVTVVVTIVVLAFTDCFRTAVITYVVLVAIYVCTD